MVQAQKKIALLHRYPADQIQGTNAAFPYLMAFSRRSCYRQIDVLTFKTFDRCSKWGKLFKSLAWIIYAPMLVIGRKYDTIYCDDSFPFYPALVKLVSPSSHVVIRLGDLHLMYYFSGFWYKFFHAIERIGWLMADEILAISHAMADYIEADTKRRPKVVLDPVDSKSFPKAEPSQDKTVMFHGLLNKNKNVDLLLEAARRLPKVDFTVLGDGPDFSRLQNLAPSNVFFYGWVPFKDVPRHIATCALGVALRSNNPGNEYVVTSPFIQYGVMGKPCLVTRRKVFGDYKWQFSNIDEMVDKIKLLLERPQEGAKLREIIVANHEAEKIAEEIWSAL